MAIHGFGPTVRARSSRRAAPGTRVGLLGGSFNPAHGGHRRISLLALRLLGLDEVWWLVTPRNPLKPPAELAPYEARLARARAVARHPRIRVSNLERRLATRFTDDTLRAVVRRFPAARFVWIMGADNLAQMPLWRHWTRIFATVPIAVFDRPTYSLVALAGKAARRYRAARIVQERARGLAGRTPPAWVFLPVAHDPVSATALRANANSDE